LYGYITSYVQLDNLNSSSDVLWQILDKKLHHVETDFQFVLLGTLLIWICKQTNTTDHQVLSTDPWLFRSYYHGLLNSYQHGCNQGLCSSYS
jgi:hypothetical protein